MYVLISERWGKGKTYNNYDKLVQDYAKENDNCAD